MSRIVLFYSNDRTRVSDPKTDVAYLLCVRSGFLHFCFVFSAWSTPRDLKALKPHEVTAYLQSPSKTKKSELYEAYRVAEDPSEWLKDQEDRANQVNQVGEDEDELAEEDEEEEEETAPATKKRKRISATDKKGDTKAKKAKLEKLAKSKVSPA